jgi:hypothetical protein
MIFCRSDGPGRWRGGLYRGGPSVATPGGRPVPRAIAGTGQIRALQEHFHIVVCYGPRCPHIRTRGCAAFPPACEYRQLIFHYNVRKREVCIVFVYKVYGVCWFSRMKLVSHWASVKLLFITSSHTQNMKLHYLLEPAALRRIRRISKATISVLPHRPPAWNNTPPAGRIFIGFYIWYFSKMCQKDSSFIKICQE